MKGHPDAGGERKYCGRPARRSGETKLQCSAHAYSSDPICAQRRYSCVRSYSNAHHRNRASRPNEPFAASAPMEQFLTKLRARLDLREAPSSGNVQQQLYKVHARARAPTASATRAVSRGIGRPAHDHQVEAEAGRSNAKRDLRNKNTPPATLA